MAERTWRKAFLLAAVGMALAAGCTINSEDGTDDDDGDAGSGGTTGGTGGKGGTGGSGGSSAGKGGSSGSGGTAGTGGTAGKGGSAGTGGSSGTAGTAGAAGSEAGAAGAPDTRTDPICDPPSGDFPGTPYDTCEPAPGEEDEPCAVCIQESCCEESKDCYAYDPGNVCGWGGPAEDGVYLGGGEIGCFRSCILDFVEENGAYDSTAEENCAASCTTEADAEGMECDGNLGTATSVLIGCLHDNCESECFEP